MTVPAIDDFATYGGIKIDYSPVEDPDTDLSADQGNQARASTAGMTRTAARIIINFTTSGGVATVTAWDAVYGNPFLYLPEIQQGIPGQWVVVLPASIQDALGTTQLLNIRWAHGQVESQTNRWTVQCKRNTSNVLYVSIFNSAGTLADPDGAGQVALWIY